MSFLPSHGDPRRSAGKAGDSDPASRAAEPAPDQVAGSPPEVEEEDVVFTHQASGAQDRSGGATPAGRTRPDHRAKHRDGGGSLGRSFGLTALGTVLPGAGLTLTRRRRLGLPLLVLALVGLLALSWYVVQHGAFRSAVDLAARPGLLRFVGVALVLGGAVWIGSIVLTAVTSRPRRMSELHRVGLIAFTGLMSVAVATPAVFGVWYINAHTRSADRIFTGPSLRQEPTEVQEVAAAATPRMEEEDPWAHLGRVNVLLLGSDAADSREGVRTDSMIVASIDTTTGDAVLFSIPRNLQNAPIPQHNPLHNVWPQGYDCGSECLLNGIWTEAEALAEERPEWYLDDPNPGQTAVRDTVSAALGQPLHYTVLVNLEGFEDLVDAMGGVDIDVQERVPIGGQTTTNDQNQSQLIPGTEDGWIEVGSQHLNGREALWYARSRSTTDDFSRMRRQRCVVAALVQQVDPMTMLQRYPQIVGVAGDNITVDISQEQLPAWADLVQRVQDGTIQSLPFTPENTDVTDPDYADIRLTVYRAVHPELTSATATGPAAGAGATSTEETRTQKASPTPWMTSPAGPGVPSGTTDSSPSSTEPPADELSDIGTVC